MASRPRFFLLLSLFLLQGFSSLAQEGNCTISAKEPDLAGRELVFYKWSDPITKLQEPVCKIMADSGGNFRCTFNLGQTTPLFLHFGIYLGQLVAEPGKNYEISFPEIKWKSLQDSLNPYFQETLLRFTVKNADTAGLNQLLAEFDSRFDEFVLMHAGDLVHRRISRKMEDSLVQNFKRDFQAFTHPFFKDYEHFRLGLFRNLGLKKLETEILPQYFSIGSVRETNPAYWELFDQAFANLFQRAPAQPVADPASAVRDYRSYLKTRSALDRMMGTDLSDSLSDLIILRNIYDQLFQNNFPSSALVQVLDSLIAQSPVAWTRSIAQRVRDEGTRLLHGFPAPEPGLIDQAGNPVSLQNFKGKYLLLAFTTSWSTPGLIDLSLLPEIRESFGDKLEIVLVCPHSEYDALMAKLPRGKNSLMLFRLENERDGIDRYRIKTFPSYFLIDPYGLFAASPSPGPQENFQGFFHGLLQRRN